MHIDIKTKNVETIRNTFSHIVRRLGDKPASRYQEATYDIQPTHNFHYRPTWQPQYELYDERRTAIKMDDWYKFLDPRQYYYGAYVMNRAKMQETADQNFTFVEKRGLLTLMPDEVKQSILARIPQGRMGTAAEVADVVAFLAIRASYINGTVVHVNGGMYGG